MLTSAAMRAASLIVLAAAFLLSPPGVARAEPELVERILAIVDDDPILLSEVDRSLALGLVPVAEEADERAARRGALDLLIAQRLRIHEVERYGFAEVPLEAVARQLETMRERFESPEAFTARLDELGLDEEKLRHLISRQLAVLTFVEERLGPRVFVGLEDIERYYREELVPPLEASGSPVPPLAELREPIRAVLKEQRLNAELERWTDELRAKAEVLDFFAERQRELPPLAFTLEGEAR